MIAAYYPLFLPTGMFSVSWREFAPLPDLTITAPTLKQTKTPAHSIASHLSCIATACRFRIETKRKNSYQLKTGIIYA